jgi:hypothetical protein
MKIYSQRNQDVIIHNIFKKIVEFLYNNYMIRYHAHTIRS